MVTRKTDTQIVPLRGKELQEYKRLLLELIAKEAGSSRMLMRPFRWYMKKLRKGRRQDVKLALVLLEKEGVVSLKRIEGDDGKPRLMVRLLVDVRRKEKCRRR